VIYHCFCIYVAYWRLYFFATWIRFTNCDMGDWGCLVLPKEGHSL